MKLFSIHPSGMHHLCLLLATAASGVLYHPCGCIFCRYSVISSISIHLYRLKFLALHLIYHPYGSRFLLVSTMQHFIHIGHPHGFGSEIIIIWRKFHPGHEIFFHPFGWMISPSSCSCWWWWCCCVVSSCGRGLWIRVCFVAAKPCVYDDDLELLLLMLMLAHLWSSRFSFYCYLHELHVVRQETGFQNKPRRGFICSHGFVMAPLLEGMPEITR